ncbi:LemA family protein [Pseudomonas aeruginosa]|uniref:LemA family protein n=1 Tax=Pseudomonas aeruginosa TaxID=287 RepID=UPI001247DD73|nr:LemA family protein [Pseudomonas aeruginosa]KAB0693580.1 LemA family protein [Pseudomonas aeruginosa]MCW5542924.1 LemA family protein [Pseudomonas aeruginosa]MCW5562966.1 LemA family protein [Pseudomonas aeruginosa]
MPRFLRNALLPVLALLLSGCGYNAMQAGDEQVKAAWSEVLNQYQRRADLVPNLVSTVKGYASHEASVLTQVTEARAKVGSVQLNADQLDDEQAVQRFQKAQGELSSALSRLLVVTENYPQLKADGLFKDLLTQLEGTENRIAVARGRYVKSVQEYNVLLRQFPGVITAKLFGYKPKANFSVENEAATSTAPKVDFGNPQPAQ